MIHIDYVNLESNQTVVPVKTFTYLISRTYIKKNTCLDHCDIKSEISYASGVMAHRSKIDGYGYILTADHFCNFAPDPDEIVIFREFSAIDYNGNKREAKHVASAAHADLCALMIRDIDNSIDFAQISDIGPAIGESVFNVSAPNGFFNPGAALIFTGNYSGGVYDRYLFTVPTKPGSSGSPIFNKKGKLIAITISTPMISETSSVGIVKNTVVVENLCLAESLPHISKFIDRVSAIDEIAAEALNNVDD